MGLYDKMTFEDGFDVDFSGLDADPTEIVWQTKTIEYPPEYADYKVTVARHLLKKEVEWEIVPEEERPYYDEEVGGFENDFLEVCGSLTERFLGWEDAGYHGTIEIHTTLEGEYISFDLKFTGGELVEITRNS